MLVFVTRSRGALPGVLTVNAKRFKTGEKVPIYVGSLLGPGGNDEFPQYTPFYEGLWDITDTFQSKKMRGRWRLWMADQISNNNATLKIDKRAQIVKLAQVWADFWPHRPENSKPPVGEPRAWCTYIAVSSPDTGKSLFTQCHNFAAYIYWKLGLYAGYQPDTAGQIGQTFATAADNGIGALRCWGSTHTGIVAGVGGFRGGWMYDINNPDPHPVLQFTPQGVTTHFFDEPNDAGVNRSIAVGGVSILTILDGE